MRFHRLRAASPAAAAAFALLLSTALPALGQDAPADAPAAAEDDPVEAVVNGIELRRSDVLESARDLPRAYQDQIEQIYPALVERLVHLTLLSQEARARGLDDDAEVAARVEEFETAVMREVLLDRVVKDGMTEDAVKGRYDQFVADFQPQPEIHARHILVASEEEAKAVIAELDAGGDFAAIAQEKSTDTGSGANGGDLGFFTPEQMVPEFSEAAVALEPGAYSKEPVQSRFGWHVIKVEEKRETQPPSFEEARPEIENQLSQELVNDLISQLSADAEIELRTPAPEEAPAVEEPAAEEPAAEDPAAEEPAAEEPAEAPAQ